MRCGGAQSGSHRLGFCLDTDREAGLLGTHGAGVSYLEPLGLSGDPIYTQIMKPFKMLCRYFSIGLP